MTFDDYFMSMAETVALKSKDRSTKVGAVVVGEDRQLLATGFNGFPRGLDDDDDSRHERPAKYEWTEHAERNAIYNAARTGVSLKGSTMYLNFDPCPCTECARAIIQAGIVELVGNRSKPFSSGQDWSHSVELGIAMLREAGVRVRRASADG